MAFRQLLYLSGPPRLKLTEATCHISLEDAIITLGVTKLRDCVPMRMGMLNIVLKMKLVVYVGYVRLA